MPSSAHARRFYRAAKQRFDDALLLLEMERTTAAVYLAGYSVECMLKALILSAVPQTHEEELLGMLHGVRAHDYEWLLHLYAEKGGRECLRLSFHTLPASTPGRRTCGIHLAHSPHMRRKPFWMRQSKS
jgi:HEPN domain-containing protein